MNREIFHMQQKKSIKVLPLRERHWLRQTQVMAVPHTLMLNKTISKFCEIPLQFKKKFDQCIKYARELQKKCLNE